jgi:pimeloyl-[acyl-carrier protein] synthase
MMFDSSNPDFLQDDHQLNEDFFKGKVLFRNYEDVKFFFQEKSFSYKEPLSSPNNTWSSLFDEMNSIPVTLKIERARKFGVYWLMIAETAKHNAIKKALMPAFQEKELKRIELYCDKVCKEILSRKNTEIEVMRDYCLPVSMLTLLFILGIHKEDSEYLNKHITSLSASLLEVSSSQVQFMGLASILELANYFYKVLKGTVKIEIGLTSRLLELTKQGVISADEFIENCILFLFSGKDSTQASIGNGIYLLANDKTFLTAKNKDDAFYSKVVNEVIRFESPVSFADKIATEDMIYKEIKIKKGDKLIGMIGAANRDKKVFPEPHKFDINREGKKHLGFGIGNHFCLGYALAIMESKIAIQNFFEVYKQPKILNTPQWLANYRIRELDKIVLKA